MPITILDKVAMVAGILWLGFLWGLIYGSPDVEEQTPAITLQATDQGYKLYGMDYPFEGHHRQVYIIAKTEA